MSNPLSNTDSMKNNKYRGSSVLITFPPSTTLERHNGEFRTSYSTTHCTKHKCLLCILTTMMTIGMFFLMLYLINNWYRLEETS